MARKIDPDLDQPLLRYSGNGTIHQSLQSKIASFLWNVSAGGPEKHAPGLATYFTHFQKEINLWSVPRQDVATETYRDFLDLVQHLETHKYRPRNSPEILSFFPKIKTGPQAVQVAGPGDISVPLAARYQHTTQISVDNALDLAVGLWLMVHMGPSNPTTFTGRSHLKWAADSTLTEAIERSFRRTPRSSVPGHALFPKDLVAHNLERIGSVQIKWTSNLKDHLSFDEDSTTLILYHFASILSLHERTDRQRSILPQGLAEETRRTLALLLPQYDTESRQWFIQAEKRANGFLDPSATLQSYGAQVREVESYEFWGHRLGVIAEYFEGVEPKGLKSWWFDRRNKVKWTNFWIAVTVVLLTVIFGFISSVTGILQVYIATKSLHQ